MEKPKAKEEIYKDYINNFIAESELIERLDCLQSKKIKLGGVIYTPWEIVEAMIGFAKPNPSMSIIEPSCGHGAFLLGLLNYMRSVYSLHGQELFEWFRNKVVGVEIEQNTVNELKEILVLYFLKHFNLSIKLTDFKNIHCHDGLSFGGGKTFDLCIGNPPYIRAKNLDIEYLMNLKLNYESCKKGTIDVYFAFIEKYLLCAKSLVFITPNSFLTSKSGSILKERLIGKITLLIDFKEKKVFKDASVYACIFNAMSVNTGVDIVYGNDLDKTKLIKKEQLTKLFGALEVKENLIDTVLSGVATLCDSAYIVKKGKDEKFYATNNCISYEIEKEIVVPYLKLTKIKSQKDLNNIAYMICPYNEDKTIISELELKKKYPLAYKYLLTVKERLLKRDKGKVDKYESWYAYGRKQGLHQIKQRYIISIPQMIGGACKPQRLDISNILRAFGKIVFTSGFIIPQNEKNKSDCDFVLGNDFLMFAKTNGKVWEGKQENYYSLTSKQIKRCKSTKDEKIV